MVHPKDNWSLSAYGSNHLDGKWRHACSRRRWLKALIQLVASGLFGHILLQGIASALKLAAVTESNYNEVVSKATVQFSPIITCALDCPYRAVVRSGLPFLPSDVTKSESDFLQSLVEAHAPG
jgi:hypothetical protein